VSSKPKQSFLFEKNDEKGNGLNFGLEDVPISYALKYIYGLSSGFKKKLHVLKRMRFGLSNEGDYITIDLDNAVHVLIKSSL
jgi:hypothetical protein